MRDNDVLTPEQLAQRFKITVEKCDELRLKHHWPHLRLGRFAVRFTPEQVAAIEHQMETAPETSMPTALTRIPGQTARSAARRRA